MDKRLDLRFEIPRPPCGPVVELSNAESEKMQLTLLGLKVRPILRRFKLG
jgi:hypothetical protein